MLSEIHLRDFRCFESLSFQPEPGLNFLIGANAQGKTSLLEAICVLLRLQSPRASSLAETIRFGCGAFGLDGRFSDRHLRMKFAERQKHYSLDSKPQSRMADYLAIGRVVWISNDDMQLVRGSGTHRRRYLDFTASQTEPTYIRHLRAYERALRSRNALLKDARPRREIAAFDGPLIESGTAVQSARAAAVESLSPLSGEACRQITGGLEQLQIAYAAANPPDLAQALHDSLAEESRLRATMVGPHRDDLTIKLGEMDAATFASEGQQRGIALALKIAQARLIEQFTATSPLLLIDDVFGELDSNRRNNLLNGLPEASQKIATTTALAWLPESMPAVRFELSDRVLRRVV